MVIERLLQGRVNEDQEENEKLDMNTRMAHVENEVVNIRTLVIEDFERRKEDKDRQKKRDDYIDKKMVIEEEEAEIRLAVKRKLYSNGAWFGLLALGSGLWWMFKEALKSHT